MALSQIYSGPMTASCSGPLTDPDSKSIWSPCNRAYLTHLANNYPMCFDPTQLQRAERLLKLHIDIPDNEEEEASSNYTSEEVDEPEERLLKRHIDMPDNEEEEAASDYTSEKVDEPEVAVTATSFAKALRELADPSSPQGIPDGSVSSMMPMEAGDLALDDWTTGVDSSTAGYYGPCILPSNPFELDLPPHGQQGAVDYEQLSPFWAANGAGHLSEDLEMSYGMYQQYEEQYNDQGPLLEAGFADGGLSENVEGSGGAYEGLALDEELQSSPFYDADNEQLRGSFEISSGLYQQYADQYDDQVSGAEVEFVDGGWFEDLKKSWDGVYKGLARKEELQSSLFYDTDSEESGGGFDDNFEDDGY